MFKLNSLFTSRKSQPQPFVSATDKAIDTFLAALENDPARNMPAARDAIAIARQRQVTRPVEIWAIYNDSIAYYV